MEEWVDWVEGSVQDQKLYQRSLLTFIRVYVHELADTFSETTCDIFSDLILEQFSFFIFSDVIEDIDILVFSDLWK